MKRIYIAYGSNMNLRQMESRCPDSKLLGVSQIEGYALEFRRGGGAVATIVPREDSRVPVVLWEISERDERNLDRYEGFPRLYYKKDFRVYLGKRKVSAFAYIMSSGYDIGIPSEYYYNVILEGYTDNEIDTKPLFAALFAAREHCSVRKQDVCAVAPKGRQGCHPTEGNRR